MRKFNTKVFISLMTLVMSVIVLSTVTYAWFNLPNQNYVENLGITVVDSSSLEVSIDGTNFTSRLSSSEIKKAIVYTKLGYSYQKQTDGTYKLVDSEGSIINPSTIDYEAEYKKTSLVPLTSLDGRTFTNIDGAETKISYGHVAKFDLFFRTNSVDVDDKGTNMYLGVDKQEYMTDNGMVSFDPTSINGVTKKFYPLNMLNTYDKETGQKKVHYPLQAVDVNPKDAMRFSIATDSRAKIYEPNLGLGSYAVNYSSYKESKDNYGSAIDSNKNAAFTYYNNIKHNTLLGMSEYNYQKLQENLVKSYSSLDDLYITKVYRDKESRVTLAFWVEGYDADCIDFINADDVNVVLSFTITPNAVEKPLTVEYDYSDGANLETNKKLVKEEVLFNSDFNDTIIPQTTRKNNYFMYWSEDKLNKFEGKIKKDTVLSAVWGVALDVNLNGGSKNYTYPDVIAGQEYTLPAPTRDGYNFEGWYTEDTYNNLLDTTKPIYNSISIFAKWAKK